MIRQTKQRLWVHFNSQPHKEADTDHPQNTRKPLYFNSQPHKEADSFLSKMFSWVFHFNSQPHKEADKMLFVSDYVFAIFQLTASQGGWRETAPKRALSADISTHSLTRRLTDKVQKSVANARFQLTASQGGWQNLSCVLLFVRHISTHSLTRRLTYFSYCSGNIRTYFNSQPHKEADDERIS